jgi:hypothetical protein
MGVAEGSTDLEALLHSLHKQLQEAKASAVSPLEDPVRNARFRLYIAPQSVCTYWLCEQVAVVRDSAVGAVRCGAVTASVTCDPRGEQQANDSLIAGTHLMQDSFVLFALLLTVCPLCDSFPVGV